MHQESAETLSTVVDTQQKVIEVFNKMQVHAKDIKFSEASVRIEKLKNLKKSLLHYQDEIRQAMYNEFKKPFLETDISEILPVTSHIDFVVKNLAEWMRPEHKKTPIELLGSYSYIVYEPKGVVLILAPWNYAFNLIFDPLVSAIAAGNCAIIKPSEYTPYAAKVVQKIVAEIFDPNEISVLEGDAKFASSLSLMPFDHIFFTGSPAVGKKVMKAAAENLVSITLELGGKSPAIVHSDADIANTAAGLVFGKFLNTGQTCIAPDYILVQKDVKMKLVDALISRIKSNYGDDESKLKESKDYGRIVSDKEFLRIENYINDALERGATLAYGGKMNQLERYIQPTILADVDFQALVMQEEIFGPVLPIITYNNLEEAFGFIEKLPKPLSCYIFSSSHNVQQKIIANTTAGGTTINDCLLHNFNPHLPFGGVNNSGIGKGRGIYGFHEFSNPRAVLHSRPVVRMSKFLSAPYTNLKYKLVGFILKYL